MLPRFSNFCAGVALLASVTAIAGDYREEQLALTLADGQVLTAQLRIPVATHGRLPAVMLFGGFRNAATVLDRVQTGTPLIWASFDYPFKPPRKFRFPDSLWLAPQMRAAIKDSMEGVGKLHSALKTHPRVDPARIIIVGASAGAPIATVSAVQYSIPGVILVQGFADVTLVVQNLLLRKYEAKWGSWVKGPAWLMAAGIVWYCEVPDIAAYARRFKSPQKVLMIAAQDDDLIPKTASEALWTALQQSDARHERMDLPGLHLRTTSTEQVSDILQRALVWMKNSELL